MTNADHLKNTTAYRCLLIGLDKKDKKLKNFWIIADSYSFPTQKISFNSKGRV